jgi:limonene-1,2-epoxide hydrolase
MRAIKPGCMIAAASTLRPDSIARSGSAYAIWIAGLLEIRVVLAAVGRPVSLLDAWVIEALAQLIRMSAFFIPSGLGVVDAAIVLVAGLLAGDTNYGVDLDRYAVDFGVRSALSRISICDKLNVQREYPIMSATNIDIVTALCHSLLDGDMAKSVSYLSSDVVYHNKPWPEVTGHAGVRKILDPFVDGENCALKVMEIHHTAAAGEVVMNARSERWERDGVCVTLPVAGVFIVRGGLVCRWDDYWDSATMKPLLDLLI